MVNYDEWMQSNMNMWDDWQIFTHGLEPVFPLGWMNTNVGVRLDVSFRSWRKKRIEILYVTSISCIGIYMNNTHVIAYINIHMHRAVRYDDMYRIDEIKSLSFHIMLYRLFRGVAKYIVYGNTFHHLSDCDLYTPPPHGGGETERPQNQELVTKRGTTSVAWSHVFKHCSFKTTDFKPLKLKQQSYMRAPSLSVRGAPFLSLNDYINTLICIRIPVFASILINTAI